MRRKSVIIILIALMLLSFSAISTEAAVNYRKIYEEYAKQLQKKSSTELCMAIINSDQPMLLIADLVPSYSTSKGYQAIVCQIYQYVKSKNKVVYIGELSSSGTSQPLRKKGKYLLAGSHHNAWRLKAKNGKAGVDAVYDVGIENKSKCEYVKWSLSNNKWKVLKTKTIPKRVGDILFNKYYTSGSVVYFKKIK
jgi:hypothetical protein